MLKCIPIHDERQRLNVPNYLNSICFATYPKKNASAMLMGTIATRKLLVFVLLASVLVIVLIAFLSNGLTVVANDKQSMGGVRSQICFGIT